MGDLSGVQASVGDPTDGWNCTLVFFDLPRTAERWARPGRFGDGAGGRWLDIFFRVDHCFFCEWLGCVGVWLVGGQLEVTVEL